MNIKDLTKEDVEKADDSIDEVLEEMVQNGLMVRYFDPTIMEYRYCVAKKGADLLNGDRSDTEE